MRELIATQDMRPAVGIGVPISSPKIQPNACVRANQIMMKTRYFALCFLAVAGLILSGCTTTTETMTTTQSQTDPTKRVHTQEELRKTGQSETGPALEKVDPSVTTSSGPR